MRQSPATSEAVATARCGYYVVAEMPIIFIQRVGNIILEAMAYGTPMISHRVGGATEILNQEPLSICLFDTRNTGKAATLETGNRLSTALPGFAQ